MEGPKRNGRNIWMLVLIVLVVGLVMVVVWMGLSRPQSSTVEPTFPALVQSTAQVSLDHAMLVSMKTGRITEFVPGDVMVFIPADSLEAEGTISIINREADMFPEAGQAGWTRPQIVNVEFRGEDGQPVSGVRFQKPLEICFGIEADEWREFSSSRSDYQVQTYDDASSPAKWIALRLVEYPGRYQLCGLTDHLSLFALAIMGESPPAGTPTDIYAP